MGHADIRPVALGQGVLGLLRPQVEVLQRLRRVERVFAGAGFLLPLLGQVGDDQLVPVAPAQEVIAVGADHGDIAALDLDHGDVERAAAQVVDQHHLVGLLMHAVGDGRRRRLVDDAAHVQPGDLPGAGGRVALRDAEVSRAGDHHIVDVIAGVLRCVLHQLAHDVGGDLLRRVLLALVVERVVLAAHLALDQLDSRVGIQQAGVLGLLADNPLRTVKLDDRGRGAVTGAVGHDGRPVVLVHVGDAGVGGAQVNAEDRRMLLAHVPSFPAGKSVLRARSQRPCS